MMRKIVLFLLLTVNLCFGTTGLILWRDLHLREGPGTGYRSVKLFHKGKYFKILEYTSSDWVKANANGYIGYFQRAAIETVPTQKYTINNPVTFKWGPSEHYKDLAYNPGDIVVEVVWTEGDYHFGQYNGSGVWFHKDDLSGPYTQREIDDMNKVQPTVEPTPPPIPVYLGYRGRNTIGGHVGLFYTSGGTEAPSINITKGYQQLYWTMGGLAGLRWSFNRDRTVGLLLRMKGVYIPKDYRSQFYHRSYEIKQRQIILDATLGFEFDFGHHFSLAVGGGYAGMQDYLSYGLSTAESKTLLNDEIIYGPTGYLEINTGLPHFRVFGGADYYYWQTDRGKFYITPEGDAIVDENRIEKHLIRGYAGVMVLF